MSRILLRCCSSKRSCDLEGMTSKTDDFHLQDAYVQDNLILLSHTETINFCMGTLSPTIVSVKINSNGEEVGGKPQQTDS